MTSPTSPAVFAFNPGGPVIVPVHAEPGHAPLTSANAGQFWHRFQTEMPPKGAEAPVRITGKDDGRAFRVVARESDVIDTERGRTHEDNFAFARADHVHRTFVEIGVSEGRYGVFQNTSVSSEEGTRYHLSLRLPVAVVRDLLGEGARVFASPPAAIQANAELARDLAIAIYLELVSDLPEYVRMKPVQGHSPMPPEAQIDVTKIENANVEVRVASPLPKDAPPNDLVFFDTRKIMGADRLLVEGALDTWRQWPDFHVEYVPSEDVIAVWQDYSETTYPLAEPVRRLFGVADVGVEFAVAKRRMAFEAERAAGASRRGPPV